MKRKFFKSAAVILALTMAFSGIPASAYALETGKMLLKRRLHQM